MAETKVQVVTDGVPTSILLVDNTEEFRCKPKSVSIGDAVYVCPDGRVARASAFVPDQVCIGMVISFESPSRCIVLVDGLARDISQGMKPQSPYYLSLEAGKLAPFPPTQPGQRHQFMGYAVTSTDLILRPDHRRILNRCFVGEDPVIMAWEPKSQSYGIYPFLSKPRDPRSIIGD